MPRKIIEGMRLHRLEDLREYMRSLDGLPDLGLQDQDQSIQERKAVLDLELPFKTDANSIMDAYEKAYRPKNAWNSKEHCLSSGQPVEEAWERNSFFNALYKEGILPIFCKIGEGVIEVPIEDFHLEAVYQLIRNKIHESDLKESMKKKYSSKLNSLRKHQGSNFTAQANLRKSDIGNTNIDVFWLSDFFRYLEDQFLDTDIRESLQELIAIRMAFYMDIPIRCLKGIKFKDFSEDLIKGKGWYKIRIKKYKRSMNDFKDVLVRFQLPACFIDLCRRAFKTNDEPMFCYSKIEFHKLVSSLSKKFELDTGKTVSQGSPSFSPKLLKKALKNICHTKQFPMAALPAR